MERELGIEQSLVWSRPRRGILATGRVDRMCLRPGGWVEAIDFKTGHPPRSRERLNQDVQAIFYRSLVAESTRWLAPGRIVVSFRYIGTATTITVDFDPIEFLDAWEEVFVAVDRIRAARLAVAAGTPLARAFPLYRGDQCAGCQFSNHCDRLQRPASAAASETKGESR